MTMYLIFTASRLHSMDPWPIAMLALVFLATDALICLTWFAERHYELQEPARS